MGKITSILLCAMVLTSAMAMTGSGNDQEETLDLSYFIDEPDFGKFSLGGFLDPKGIVDTRIRHIQDFLKDYAVRRNHSTALYILCPYSTALLVTVI